MAIERGDVGFVLGLAGFLLGGAGLALSLSTQKVVEDYHGALVQDGETIEGLVRRMTAMEEASSGAPGHAPISREEFAALASDLVEANKRISAGAKDTGFAKDDIAGLRARLAQIEKQLPPK